MPTPTFPNAPISLVGTEANDSLLGGSGNDSLTGGLGHDLLNGGSGDDLLTGGSGNDTYVIDSLFDQITEEVNSGVDQVRSAVSYTLAPHLEKLVLTGTAETGIGNELDNILLGNEVSNSLVSGDGNDLLYGWAGDDVMLGGLGDDYLDAGWGNDWLEGGDGNDTLYGVYDNDTLLGGAGDDVLVGGVGDDVLTGGAGADQFKFYSSTEGTDTLTDFQPLEGDQLWIRASQFGSGLTAGELLPEQLTLGATATGANDRFIYNTATGGLFFDTDGTGSAAQVQLATLATGLTLASSNITVFEIQET